jgi:hypothetical protein
MDKDPYPNAPDSWPMRDRSPYEGPADTQGGPVPPAEKDSADNESPVW